MKSYFIINPAAGDGSKVNELKERIMRESDGFDVEIYITKSKEDTARFVKNICDTVSGDLRFYACGGDGTLNDVLNGLVGCERASLGVVPIGTGNDFCRNFTDCGDFKSVKDQLNGTTTRCDIIKYSGIADGKYTERYAVNMFNIGFDCNVVDKTQAIKKYAKGSAAYLLSVMIILIKKKGANLKIEADGKIVHNGPLLLTTVANGSFCGGGIMSNPKAVISDGLLDVNIVKNVSRAKFIKLFPKYKKGTHYNIKNAEKIIRRLTCKKLTLTPNGENMRICADGEIFCAKAISFESQKNAVSFIVPQKILNAGLTKSAEYATI